MQSRTLILILLLAGCTGQLEVINQTQRSIYYVHFSPTDASSWGQDQLGSSTLDPGESRRWSVFAGDYDVRVKYDSSDGPEEATQLTVHADQTSTFYATGDDLSPSPEGVAESSPASAGSGATLTVVNATNVAIFYVHFSAPTESWGEDRLGAETISPGVRRSWSVSPGTYDVLARFHEPEKNGDWKIRRDVAAGEELVVRVDSVGPPTTSETTPAETATPDPIAITAGTHTGSLASGDATRETNKRVDWYLLTCPPGGRLSVSLSAEFDTYLLVTDPGGDAQTNDDRAEGNRNSYLGYASTEAGVYRIGAASFGDNVSGDYSLEIALVFPEVAPVAIRPGTVNGELQSGDSVVGEGKLVDWFLIECPAGGSLLVDLTSSAFDGYLRVVSPSGVQTNNDDRVSGNHNPLLLVEPTESGTYRVGASSYSAAKTGRYTLSTTVSAQPQAATPRPSPTATPTQAAGPITLLLLPSPGTVRGLLQEGDDRSDGNYVDWYALDCPQGVTLVVDVSSPAFDGFLRVIGPGGDVSANDDRASGNKDPLVEVAQTRSGRYRIGVAALAGKRGPYTLTTGLVQEAQATVRATPRPRATPAASPRSARGRTFVLVVGINDYDDDRITTLRFAENDARSLYAFYATNRRSPATRDRVRRLYGAQATRRNVLKAIRQHLERNAVRSEDTVVLYFSGHGFADAQQTYLATVDTDLDELPETSISLDSLQSYWSRVRAGTKILITDACHSGGLAGLKGVGGVARLPVARAGANSQTVVLSAAAANQLSTEDEDLGRGVFTNALVNGLQGGADEDRDGQVTLGELRDYLNAEVPAQATQVGGEQTPTIDLPETMTGVAITKPR